MKGWSFVGPSGEVHWDALELMMLLGSEGHRVVLSFDECAALLQIARGETKRPTKPNHRPNNPDTEERHIRIAYHTLVQQNYDGTGVEAAIADAMAFFEVSRKTVTDCRRKWLPGLRSGSVHCLLDGRQSEWFLKQMRKRAAARHPKS